MVYLIDLSFTIMRLVIGDRYLLKDNFGVLAIDS